MWWAPWACAERFDLYLGLRLVAACKGEVVVAAVDPSTEGRMSPSSDSATSPAHVGAQPLIDSEYVSTLAAFARVAAGLPVRPRLHVWLSGELCRPFLVPSTLDLNSPAEEEAVVRRLAARAMQHERPLRIWLSHGPRAMKRRPGGRAAMVIGAAVEERLLRDISSALGPRRARIIAPWWAAAADMLTRPREREAAGLQSSATQGRNNYLAARDSDGVTVLAMQSDSILKATTLSACYDAPSSRAALARYALGQEDFEQEPLWVELTESTHSTLAERMAARDALPLRALARRLSGMSLRASDPPQR